MPNTRVALSIRSASNPVRPSVYRQMYIANACPAQANTALGNHDDGEYQQAPERFVQERRGETSRYWVYPAGLCARSIFKPQGSVVGRPKSSWLK